MIIFTSMVRKHEIDLEKELMETIVNQVQKSFEETLEVSDKTKELFVRHYQKCSDIVEEFVVEHKKMTSEDWKKCLDYAEVNSINIVDERGIIIQSSNKNNVAINLHDDKELYDFIPMIEDWAQDSYRISFASLSEKSKENNILFGVPIEKTKGLILMELPKSEYEKYSGLTDVEEFMDVIPTKESRTLFVADVNGNILGITQNNKEYIHSEELVKLLKDAEDHTIKAELNGEMQLLLTKQVDHYYVGYMSGIDTINAIGKNYFGQFFIFLIILLIVIALAMYYLIHYFILKDIDMLTNKAHKFTNGDASVHFDTMRTKELNQLSNELNRVLRVIQSKNERISTIASLMGESFGAYEYDAGLKQIYYSENVPALLGADSKEECEKMIIQYYQNHITDLQEKREIEIEEIKTNSKGQKIKIRKSILKDVSYGFIEDISQEAAYTKRLMDSLEQEKERNYIDSLTSVYNRLKIKQTIENHIKEKKDKQGVMILMDLDNFKIINDQLGHLEGDSVLEKFADILVSHFRSTDIVARLGGDEFSVFLSGNISKKDLKHKLDYLLELFRQEFNGHYKTYQLSVSIGIAYLENGIQTFEELYQLADEAMYMAKRSGKDDYYIYNGQNEIQNGEKRE